MQRLLSNFLVASALAVAGTAQTITIPQQGVGVEGTSTTGYPWSPGTLATGSIRSQYLYTKNAFLNQSVNFPIVINQLSWRANGAAVGGGSTFPNVQVLLSTATPGAILAPNVTFANNHGPDVTTVYPSGPVTMLPLTGATPNSFICTLTLATPFPYDPNAGDLCIDISNQNAIGIAGLQSDLFTTLGADGARVWDWTPGATFMNPASGNNQPGLAIVVEVGYAPPSGTLATNTTLGVGCVKQNTSFYENFGAPAGFDLDNTVLTMIPNGLGGYIVLNSLGALLPVGSIATPVSLTLGDDTEVTQAFTTGTFPGATSFNICSNGYVSIGSNGTTYTPDVVGFLNATNTAWRNWHDFNPSLVGSGQVKYEESAAAIVVTWDGVWDYGGTSVANANTFQMQFYPSGQVTLAWGTMSHLGNGHLVGYSPGGASADPGSRNLSALGAGVITLDTTDVVPLGLSATTRPILGTNWNLTTNNVPATGIFGIDVFGIADPGIPDLFFLGMPTCQLRSTLDVMQGPWLVGGPTHNYSFAVPALPLSLIGFELFTQSAVWQVPPVNAFGAVTSNGIKGKLGDV